jgi:hypothetical protein
VAAALLTFALDTAKEAFDLILSIGAGTGLIYLLRWFWWRVNAWSEIAAMTSSFIMALAFFIAGKQGHPVASHIALIATVATTTVVWVLAAFLAPGTDRETLVRFCQLVRPAGPGWAEIRRAAGVAASPTACDGAAGLGDRCTFVYAALFGTGSFHLRANRPGSGLAHPVRADRNRVAPPGAAHWGASVRRVTERAVILARRARHPDAAGYCRSRHRAPRSTPPPREASRADPGGPPLPRLRAERPGRRGLRRVCLVVNPAHPDIPEYYGGPGRPTRLALEFAPQPNPSAPPMPCWPPRPSRRATRS